MEEEVHPADPLAAQAPLLAAVRGASVTGRLATGPRAGARVRRLGSDPETEAGAPAPSGRSGATPHAHLDGFDLHAGVFVPAGGRRRLEHVVRYVLRPPIAQTALELLPDGIVLLELRRPWRDGTRAILLSPRELSEPPLALPTAARHGPPPGRPPRRPRPRAPPHEAGDPGAVRCGRAATTLTQGATLFPVAGFTRGAAKIWSSASAMQCVAALTTNTGAMTNLPLIAKGRKQRGD